jgi:hypothetical protein
MIGTDIIMTRPEEAIPTITCIAGLMGVITTDITAAAATVPSARSPAASAAA